MSPCSDPEVDLVATRRATGTNRFVDVDDYLQAQNDAGVRIITKEGVVAVGLAGTLQLPRPASGGGSVAFIGIDIGDSPRSCVL